MYHGYNGRYQASNTGKIRSTNYHREYRVKELFCVLDKDGYVMTKLCKNGIANFKRVHRLVAEAFIPNPENKPQVNHIDGNKQNNNIANLEWVSNRENMHHAFKTGLMANIYKPRNKFGKKVYQYNKNGKLIKIWNSTREIEKTLCYFHSAISACCLGKIKQAYEYIWSYEEVV